ncbi:MAG: APC family permease [Lysobacteraceae bacterium]
MQQPNGSAGTTLRRAVPRWQLQLIAMNGVVGSGIYLLPASVTGLLGDAALWGILLAGLAMSLIVLCYAEASSYFDRPGAAYLYAREAFGDFIGFEVGWMTWLTRLASAAALVNGLALALVPLWPSAGEGWGRALVVTVSLVFFTGLNIVGVRAAATTSALMMIGKLLPLLFFIVVGMAFADNVSVMSTDGVDGSRLGEAALLLLFAYAGFENLPAAAGEYRNPRRDLPVALVSMIVTVTLIYALVQIVAQGLLPDLPSSSAPLADAATVFAGAVGLLLLSIGALISIIGTTGDTILFGPRYLQAMAADGYGPALFARVHPRFRTPAWAVLLVGAASLALALSGSFVQLALLSVISRLLTYLATAASVLALRRRYPANAARFRLPGGPLLPLLAILVSLGLLAAATWMHLLAAGAALLIGVVIFALRQPPRDAGVEAVEQDS